MNKQKGVTLTGLLMVSILLIAAAMLAFKLVPVYLEYSAIKRQFRSMAEDPLLRTARRADLERAWASRATVDNIRSITGDNIEFTKEADGWLITGDYSVKVHLFANVSACLDFRPTSRQ